MKIFFKTATVFFALRLLAAPLGAAAEAPAEPEPELAGQWQSYIELLENEEKRAELIKFLRLMEALDQQSPAIDPAELPPESPAPEGWLSELKAMQDDFGQGFTGLGLSWRYSRSLFSELSHSLIQAWPQWRAYGATIFGWALVSWLLLLIGLTFLGCPLDFQAPWRSRLKAALKYGLKLAMPFFVVWAALWALPEPPSVPEARLALGLNFVHELLRSLFLALALICLYFKLSSFIFQTGRDSRLPMLDLHPAILRHLRRGSRILVIYLAACVFFLNVFIEQFARGELRWLLLALLALPVSVYLTVSLTKLRRLIEAVENGEEAVLGLESQTPAVRVSEIDFKIDAFFRRRWTVAAIAAVWLITLLSLADPAASGQIFLGRLAGTTCLVALAALLIKLGRILLLGFIGGESPEKKRLISNLDIALNILIWLLIFALAAMIWGFPLSLALGSDIGLEISSRALAIAVVVGTTALFVRFSRSVLDWILASPNLRRSRNWRTAAPLVLNTIRSLAVFIAVVVVLERLGVNVGPILAGAGILGLGVGLGAQSLVKDVINGLTILFMNTLSVGDYVTIANFSGTVEHVGLRSIRLRDPSGNLVVVPNSVVDSIVNMTRDYSQDLVEFKAPFDADPDLMLDLARRVAAELDADPAWQKYLTAPSKVMGVMDFDDSGTTIRLQINTQAGSQWLVGRELRLRLKRALLRNGMTSSSSGRRIFLCRSEETEQNAERADFREKKEDEQAS